MAYNNSAMDIIDGMRLAVVRGFIKDHGRVESLTYFRLCAAASSCIRSLSTWHALNRFDWLEVCAISFPIRPEVAVLALQVAE